MSNKHAYLSLILLLVLAGSVLGQDEPPATEDKPTNPDPANGAVDVPVNPVLSWTAAENYHWNDVNFGTDPDDPEYQGRQPGTRFKPGLLEPKTTYYWRIDTENDEGMTGQSSPVWSFTTGDRIIVPLDGWESMIFGSTGFPREGEGEALPAVDGAVELKYDIQIVGAFEGATCGTKGMSQIFSQPQNFSGCDQLTINWHGKEGNGPLRTITILVKDSEGNVSLSIINLGMELIHVEDSKSCTIPLENFRGDIDWSKIIDIRIFLETDGKASSGTLSFEIYFGPPPPNASGPNPMNGSTDVELNPTLLWIPGKNAIKHDVYIGTDKDAVNNANDDTYRGRYEVPSMGFSSDLEPETTYYWRIDEVDAEGNIIKGEVWSFTTSNEKLVDDFEGYDENNPLWNNWTDGFGYWGADGQFHPGFGNGSRIDLAKGTAYTGSQSMLIEYKFESSPNEFSPNEFSFEFSGAPPYKPGEHGTAMEDLSLWFRGKGPGFTEDPETGKLFIGPGADTWNEADEFYYAYKQLIGNGWITASVVSAGLPNSWAKAGVMIRETLEEDAKYAFTAVTPASSVSFQRRPEFAASSENTNAPVGITVPYWVRLKREDNLFIAEYSADGESWQAVIGEDTDNPSILMNPNVYIGLAVTGGQAAYTDVNIIGDVQGEWKDSNPGNDPGYFYVKVTDNSDQEASVYHPDNPNAIQIDTWTEWNIDLSQFANQGIDLTDVNSIAIGVDNRANPELVGAGTLYVDDIRVCGPPDPEPEEEDCSGVKAEYFSGMILAGEPILSQIEPQIDHDWGSGVVAGGLSDLVSARWRANLEVPVTGTYTFNTNSDDGVAFWLDGRLLIDNWTDHSVTVDTATVDLTAGQYYMLRMEWYENSGDAVAQLSWESDTMGLQIISDEWLQIPLWATGPTPRNGENNVNNATSLEWHPGDNAVQHDVYFGTDADTVENATMDSSEQRAQQVQRAYTSSAGDKGRQAVTANAASDVYKGRQTETTYNPGLLEWGKTYYWRVDEVEADDTIRKGALWSFTTANLLHIENFESYDDNFGGGTVIFFTWFDGMVNGSGSQAGHDFSFNGTFGDTTVFYDGGQSLPLYYNNNKTGSLKYSEVGRTFTPTLDMTVNGMDTLTLYVHGQTGNGIVPLYVGLQSGGNRKNVTYSDQMIVRSTSWVEVNIPLADFTGVNTKTVNAIYIGLGNPDAPTPGGSGLIYIDAIRATKAVP